jgi:hypothetical protein
MAKRAPAAKRPSKRRAPASPRGRKRPAAKSRVLARSGGVTVAEIEELDALRKEIERAAGKASPLRWNANPDDVQRSVVQLVLTLVEFIRKLLERQAIRRMGAGTLTPQQTEDVGRALMQLEDTVRDLAARFGISPDELNLDLGPVGKLM